MSYGKMNLLAQIVRKTKEKDSEGFVKEVDTVIANIRVYKEGRHGSEKWANLAAFSIATDLFRFRRIPGIRITTSDFIICDGEQYAITSVEDIRGKNMYLEVLAKKVDGTNG